LRVPVESVDGDGERALRGVKAFAAYEAVFATDPSSGWNASRRANFCTEVMRDCFRVVHLAHEASFHQINRHFVADRYRTRAPELLISGLSVPPRHCARSRSRRHHANATAATRANGLPERNRPSQP
jgi:hypothetical protein